MKAIRRCTPQNVKSTLKKMQKAYASEGYEISNVTEISFEVLLMWGKVTFFWNESDGLIYRDSQEEKRHA